LTGRVVLASAGTGKTFQLTNELLGLLFSGVDHARVLVTTFTRKAAGEILDRLLGRLLDAAGGGSALEELQRELGRKNLSARDCAEKLAGLCRSIDRFAICTLDAFFVNLGSALAPDVGLPSRWRILDDVEDLALREEALTAALAQAERGEWTALLRALQGSSGPRSVRAALRSAIEQGRAAFLDSTADAWRFDPGPGFSAEEIARMRSALGDFRVPTNKSNGEPNSFWLRAWQDSLRLFDAGSWRDLLKLGLFANLGAGKPFAGHDIDERVFGPIRQHALHVLLVALLAENEATHELLGRFERSYGALKRLKAGFRFEDLPAALGRVEQEKAWFGLDRRIDHLLVDEFQDTAPLQWAILRPVADELCASREGRSLFCVGDLKQSIYGWREAEPRILERLPLRYGLEPQALAKSYRSSPVVLDAVNRVFGEVAENAMFADSQPESPRRWQQSFHRHEAVRARSGAAWLLQADPSSEGEEPELPALRLAAERAAQIARAAPAATIGILLRRGRFIARMIYLLRACGVRASGEGGNPLCDSAAVLHVLSLLHLADHPGDAAAAFHLASSPLAPLLGLVFPNDGAQRSDFARGVRAKLLQRGYGRFLAELVSQVSGPGAGQVYGEWDRRRLEQLVELGFAFDARARSRPSEFVDLVRAEKVEDPFAARIQVMTIHSAKGLEFDAVILPELDLDPRPLPGILTERPDPEGPLVAVSRTASRELLQSHPSLERLLRASEDKIAYEFLCLLYVAMTRAIHRLDMIVQAKTGSGWSAARLLRLALARDVEPRSGILWGHERNEDPCFPPELLAHREGGEAAPEVRPSLARSQRPRSLRVRSPSLEKGAGLRTGEQVLARTRSSGARRGILVHRWLAEIEWLEDFAASDEALLALGLELERDETLLRQALAELRQALLRPNLSALLSRRGEDATVWREREFAAVLPAEGSEGGGEALWCGAFDRVVVGRKTAEIIDFKTDRIEPSEIGLRAERYRLQLEAYRRVLGAMCAIPVASIRCRLAFVALDSIVEL
jgi:ATP-dependent exoDNAse (exonuclease V) beta subunit